MTDTNERIQILGTNEVLGALLTKNMNNAEVVSFSQDPAAFIYSRLNVDASATTLSVVENGFDTIHLALPYYDSLSSMSAEQLSEGSMDSISGGEVIIAVILGISAVGAITLAGSVGAAAAVKGIIDDEHLDGSSK